MTDAIFGTYTVYAYFEQVALDVGATRRTLAEARDRRLTEVSQLLAGSNAEQRRPEERLSRVRRDYQDGRLDADDWQEQRAELAAEHDAAKAETQRLRDQERDVAEWAELVDAEQATLERLTEIRRAIAGELRGSDAIESVRAAVAHTFERFVLRVGRGGLRPLRDGGPGAVGEAVENGTISDSPVAYRHLFEPISVPASRR